MNPLATRLALALTLCAPAAMGASLCDGQCSVTMDFPTGGSISAPDGAAITFGPAGAHLTLGEGGSITSGEVTPVDGGLPDMTQGGEAVLYPGGSITFGAGGSLATGALGAISSNGAFDVASARTVTIDSPQAVRLGDLTSHGVIEVASQDDILYEEAGNPFTFTMPADDTGSHFNVVAAGDVVWGKIRGLPNITLTATNSISAYFEGTLPSGEPVEPALSCGGEAAGTIYLTGSGTPPADSSSSLCLTTITLDGTIVAPAAFVSGPAPETLRVSDSANAAGPMGWFGLLAMGLAALGRRRR